MTVAIGENENGKNVLKAKVSGMTTGLWHADEFYAVYVIRSKASKQQLLSNICHGPNGRYKLHDTDYAINDLLKREFLYYMVSSSRYVRVLDSLGVVRSCYCRSTSYGIPER